MLDETQELQLIKSVLVETFPEESQRVGRTNLNDVVRRRGQVRVVPLTGASKLEWMDSLILLANSATLLSQWLIAVRNNTGSKDHGKPEWHLHFNETSQNIRIGRVEARQVSMSNGSSFSIPPEIADKLDSAALGRLISSFIAHLDAMPEQGSDSREPE